MTISFMLISALAGWCGTLYPGWLRELLKHLPQPHPPEPDPWRRRSIISAFAGLASGFAVNSFIIDSENVTASVLIAFVVSGFVAGRFVGNISDRVIDQMAKR